MKTKDGDCGQLREEPRHSVLDGDFSEAVRLTTRALLSLGFDPSEAESEAVVSVWMVMNARGLPASNRSVLIYTAVAESRRRQAKDLGLVRRHAEDGSRHYDDPFDRVVEVEAAYSREISPDDAAMLIELEDLRERWLKELRLRIEALPSGSAFVWVVDAVREGYRTAAELAEWSGEPYAIARQAYLVYQRQANRLLAELKM